MNKIIVIVGPTGVGKTKLSIELAKKLNGEIINADSMQIYKEMNIGTAKIMEAEKEGIVHHLFDIRSINEKHSIYDYQKEARTKIEEIFKQNKTPIFVGGSGLYIKAALYNYNLELEEEDIDISDLTNEELHNKINNKEIHINNRKRLERAYQKQIKGLKNNNKNNELLYNTVFIGLTTDRENLYKKINERVETMFNNGLEIEAKELYLSNKDSKALSTAIGYKELFEYFKNNITLEDAKELIKRNSRRYAKRQYTWFNNQMNITWFNVNYNNFNKTIDEVIGFIKDEENESL